jgi:hypothetical protein
MKQVYMEETLRELIRQGMPVDRIFNGWKNKKGYIISYDPAQHIVIA